MIRFSLKDILLNLAIQLPLVDNLARKKHKTGILNNQKLVSDRVDYLKKLIDIHVSECNSIIEFGPGQNSHTIHSLLYNSDASVAFAIDKVNYFDDNYWSDLGVIFLNNCQSIDSGSIDFVYGFDVLEHLQDPMLFISEVRRVISSDGAVFFSWDLRDHLNLNQEEKWFEMHKYNDFPWNLQMFNRSSYVNRLVFVEWIDLFEASGFEVSIIDRSMSKLAADSFEKKFGVAIDATYRVTAILKPI